MSVDNSKTKIDHISIAFGEYLCAGSVLIRTYPPCSEHQRDHGVRGKSEQQAKGPLCPGIYSLLPVLQA